MSSIRVVVVVVVVERNGPQAFVLVAWKVDPVWGFSADAQHRSSRAPSVVLRSHPIHHFLEGL